MPACGPEEGPADTADTSVRGRTWHISTLCGCTVSGYLPAWAEDDPTATGVPFELLPILLDDVNHTASFDGQLVPVHSPVSRREPSHSEEEYIFRAHIACRPYTEDPEPRLPIVNIEIVGDLWINGLDPAGLAELASTLRAQADRLDHEVRSALVAAREDWAARHSA
jgi:hypothetical protein